MIYINECKRHNTNTFGLLKKTVRKELSEHNGVQCICSSRFTKFMEKRNLGKAPITTEELVQLLKAL